MKSRPILLSQQMIGSTLRKEKTETRRIILPQPARKNMYIETIFSKPWKDKFMVMFLTPRGGYDGLMYHAQCPYGYIGDELWVREKWATDVKYNNLKPIDLPEGAKIYYAANTEKDWNIQSNGGVIGRWRASIHMPKAMSRIILQIDNIKAEKLQDITALDASREGFGWINGRRDGNSYMEFQEYWDVLNKKRGFGWSKNPWVWVIQYKVIKKIV